MQFYLQARLTLYKREKNQQNFLIKNERKIHQITFSSKDVLMVALKIRVLACTSREQFPNESVFYQDGFSQI